MTAADRAAEFAAVWALLAPDAPAPIAEYRFHGTRRWRFDWAWPLQRIAVEVDGGQFAAFGGGRHNTDADRTKHNHAAADRWCVLHFSPRQLERDPAGCVELVRQALARVEAMEGR